MARKKESVVMVGDTRRKRLGRKQIALLLMVAIILVAGGLIGGVLWRNRNHSVMLESQREALVTQAVPYLSPEDLAKLAPIAAKIKQQPGYATDVDCMYVLTTYYLNATDAANAKTYYTALLKLYETKAGYTNPLLKGAETPTQLKSYYTLVQQQANSFYHSWLPGNPSP